MKPIIKLILLILFLQIGNLSYSQDSLKNTLDSNVIVPLRHIVAANKAFTEVKGLRKVVNSQKQEIAIRTSEIESLQKSYNHLWKADSLNTVTIGNLKTQSDAYSSMYEDYKKAYKRTNREKIGVAVSIPVVAVLSFLLGFYLH